MTSIDTTKSINIEKVNFENTLQCEHLGLMLLEYSKDIMGGGSALDASTITKSISLLSSKDYAHSFLAYDDGKPVGFANCFENIATFKGLTALNIHDLAVIPSHRKKGIASKLLNAIETHARSHNMAKITLEVLEGNIPAKSLYEAFGFKGYELDPTMGNAVFWQKMLA